MNEPENLPLEYCYLKRPRPTFLVPERQMWSGLQLIGVFFIVLSLLLILAANRWIFSSDQSPDLSLTGSGGLIFVAGIVSIRFQIGDTINVRYLPHKPTMPHQPAMLTKPLQIAYCINSRLFIQLLDVARTGRSQPAQPAQSGLHQRRMQSSQQKGKRNFGR